LISRSIGPPSGAARKRGEGQSVGRCLVLVQLPEPLLLLVKPPVLLALGDPKLDAYIDAVISAAIRPTAQQDVRKALALIPRGRWAAFAQPLQLLALAALSAHAEPRVQEHPCTLGWSPAEAQKYKGEGLAKALLARSRSMPTPVAPTCIIRLAANAMIRRGAAVAPHQRGLVPPRPKLQVRPPPLRLPPPINVYPRSRLPLGGSRRCVVAMFRRWLAARRFRSNSVTRRKKVIASHVVPPQI
jgi:hypothetical protein